MFYKKETEKQKKKKKKKTYEEQKTEKAKKAKEALDKPPFAFLPCPHLVYNPRAEREGIKSQKEYTDALAIPAGYVYITALI